MDKEIRLPLVVLLWEAVAAVMVFVIAIFIGLLEIF